MASFWLAVILPMLGGTICITGIGLTRRYALKGGGLAPLPFLGLYYALATVLFTTIYLALWGLTYPAVRPGFWAAVLISTMVNVLIQYCNAKAASLDRGEVSLTAPLQAMTPGLITFLAITLGEFPGPKGILGVGLMMLGSYVLLWDKTPEHWLDYIGPLRRLRLLLALRRLETGERNKTIVIALALGSASLGTIGLLFDGLYTRRGVGAQGLTLGAMTFTAILSGVYIAWHRVSGSKTVSVPLRQAWSKKITLATLACSLMWVAHILLIWPAYHHTLVAYVGTLKRFSVLFSVLAGWWLFRESDIKKRLWAGALIVAGAIFISLDDIPARLTHQLEGLGF